MIRSDQPGSYKRRVDSRSEEKSRDRFTTRCAQWQDEVGVNSVRYDDCVQTL